MTHRFLSPDGTDSIEHKPFKCTLLILHFSRMIHENIFFPLQLVFIHSFIFGNCILHRSLRNRTPFEPPQFGPTFASIGKICNLIFKIVFYEALDYIIFSHCPLYQILDSRGSAPQTFEEILEDLFNFYLLKKVNDD